MYDPETMKKHAEDGVFLHSRIDPKCIKYYPGVILDVFLPTTVRPTPVDLVRSGTVIKELEVGPPSSYTTTALAESVSDLSVAGESEPNSRRSFHLGPVRRSTIQIEAEMKVATDAMIAANRAGRELDISIGKGCLPAEYRDKLDTIVGQNHAIFDQVVQTKQIALEVFELQKKMDDRLNLIQRKTEAILTQNYELLEYTIPRLFIVLPEVTTSWDSVSMFSTRFRLHFICECGEHTKPAEGSMVPAGNIPHELHLPSTTDMSSGNQLSSSRSTGLF